MSDPLDPARLDPLRRRALQLAALAPADEPADGPPLLVERFWQSVIDCEVAPAITDFEVLTRAGVGLPPPAALADADLPGKLWEVIRELARRRVLLERTDHLGDRELYARLWHKCLRDEHPDLPADDSTAWHIDVLGAATPEEVWLEHRYYATDRERRDWLAAFPDYDMPPREPLPYDRDRFLPKAEYRPLAGPGGPLTGDAA